MKISYLFGAGASKQCLPIVNEIPNRIKSIIELLEKSENQLSSIEIIENTNPEITLSGIQDILISDLNWLVNESENHASIDTFAKKLFVKKNYKDLDRLKASFSVYLLLEQIINPPDKRYDAFFASILKSNLHEFPDNLRILSWNYDSQFEIAYIDYSDHKSLETNWSLMNIFTKYSYLIPKNKGFSILKINGSTILLQDKSGRQRGFIDDIPISLTVNSLKSIITNFAHLRLGKQRLYSGLSFAWERYGDPNKDIIIHAKNETSDTEVLVVIGYSFPYFNREIDREIIQNMLQLKKVYFQAPDAGALKERFLSIRDDINPNMLISRFDLDQFILPNEL